MSKALPRKLPDLLKLCLDNAADALLTYEIYFTLRAERSRIKYQKVFREFDAFFKTVTPSVFAYMMMALYKIGETGKRKASIHRVVEEASKTKLITSSEHKKLIAEIVVSNKIWEKVSIVRNNLLGHTNDTMTLAEIFAKVNIQVNELEALAKMYATMLNFLGSKIPGIPKLEHKKHGETTFENLKTLLDKLDA